jgi:hypothetical protein
MRACERRIPLSPVILPQNERHPHVPTAHHPDTPIAPLPPSPGNAPLQSQAADGAQFTLVVPSPPSVAAKSLRAGRLLAAGFEPPLTRSDFANTRTQQQSASHWHQSTTLQRTPQRHPPQQRTKQQSASLQSAPQQRTIYRMASSNRPAPSCAGARGWIRAGSFDPPSARGPDSRPPVLGSAIRAPARVPRATWDTVACLLNPPSGAVRPGVRDTAGRVPGPGFKFSQAARVSDHVRRVVPWRAALAPAG